MDILSTSSRSERLTALHRIADGQAAKKKMNFTSQKMIPVSEYFGELTFGLGQMREKLPRDAYTNLKRNLDKGEKISKEAAEAIALVIKEWAVSKGATHFSHWFQPMTGLTAEKHDAFVSIQYSDHSELRVIERFTGSQLIQGEPDASSFPSGGMRTTFEARGYTAWDPSSPIFIMEGEGSRTLCIPSVFFGYHGQALDNKTPLLRSAHTLSKDAVEFLKLVGDVDAKFVNATLGAEQEYFLIDREFVALRPDIIMTGRTLLGAAPSRGQQLEDHYFGAIPTRVKAFMEDAEQELYRLGIPVKTRHNEVAPSQFELAPIFESMNIATDHNSLTMETLKRVAIRHGLVCLLHEKPFDGLNGSGKHCNWSIGNDKGENLLDPGTTPHQNLRFLAVLSIVVRAVANHAGVLRAAIASSGNDHRLGGNEAPPAIISVFLGSMLSKILDSIESGKAAEATDAQIINLGASGIPTISKDYTDRNRTSPFAFTGNKFEFRAVGSSANTAVPVTMLTAAVADSFRKASARLRELIAKKGSRDEAVMELIGELIVEGKKVRFEGNNYSAEWRKEAEKRKLPILDTTPEALAVLNKKSETAFLVEGNVLTAEEIQSRYHINVERYVKTVVIELHTLSEMVQNQVIPTIETQLSRTMDVAERIKGSKTGKIHLERVEKLQNIFGEVLTLASDLDEQIAKLDSIHDEEEKMTKLSTKLLPAAKELRKVCDLAELMVADELWPLPKYREMLFANTIT